MLFSRLVRPCWLRRTVTVASLPSLLALMAMWCAQPSPSRSRTWLREPPNASPWLKPGLTMNQRTGVIGNEMVKWRPRLRLTLLRLRIGNGRAPFHVCAGRKPAPELRFTNTRVEEEVTVWRGLLVGSVGGQRGPTLIVPLEESRHLVTRSGRP